ncbi:MAG: hypothetical protein CM1200mP1_14620 [Candidatus Neomarinimicrobiota bacterium]|nr:MAG: hypothetical protein CM1200mP1_14620 [Candidatus Neomarinimicrobiota bacterium]
MFVLRPTFNINQPSVQQVFILIPTDGTVTFSWNIGIDSSISFRVYRDEEPGFTPSSSNLIAELAYPAATYSDENLDTNKIYYYILSAVNQEGTESDFSSEFKITPLVYVNVPPTIDWGFKCSIMKMDLLQFLLQEFLMVEMEFSRY